MPTICTIPGIKVTINWRDHLPPHFHASYAGHEALIDIEEIELMSGNLPHKQLKIVLGWAACHQAELMENWELAQAKEPLFDIPATFQ